VLHRSDDADRIAQCASKQVQQDTTTAVCQPGIAQAYTVVAVPPQGLDAPADELLEADQRDYVHARIKSDPGVPFIVVFRRDGHYSRAMYVHQYFEIERASVARKEAGQELRILIDNGRDRARIVGLK
jgi:hypothetical protein